MAADPRPPPPTLPSRLLSQAARSPSRVFIECWSPSDGVSLRVTFAELSDCMLAAAHWLSSGIGVQKGDHVAMLAGNSVAYLSISFGAMALGAISLNLNWRQPTDVTVRLVAEAKPKLLVASAGYKAVAASCHAYSGVKVALLEAACNFEPGALPFRKLDAAEAEAMSRRVAELDASLPAAVFFTGGTTGVPKAVPHSHAGLLWFAEAALAEHPEPYAEGVHGAGSVCFTPFFHVMGFVANLVFNLHAGCRAFVLTGDATLSPSLVLEACAQLRPSALNTVPWVLEGIVELLRAEPSKAAALKRLHLVTYGGAALAPHCPDELASHGVRIACTYGQTELAGPVMFGQPGGDPNALRPLPGVKFELVASADDAEGEGELILLGNGSATLGYLTPPERKAEYRSLTGGASCSPTERFATNDRFRRVTLPTADGGGGEEWLLYICRADDLLVHTSGEMSNPLPTEQRLVAECSSYINAVAVVGTNMPRCLALLELREGIDAEDEGVRSKLRNGLRAANGTQPIYSAVLEQHAILLPPGSLPLTVKGTVQRSVAERRYAPQLHAARQGTSELPTLAQPLGLGACSADAGSYDSLNLAAATGGSHGKGSCLDYLSGVRFFLTLWMLMYHCTESYGFPYIDLATRRSYVGITFFVVMSGFTTHYAYARTPLLQGPKGRARTMRVGGYVLRRLDRIVLTSWVSMTMMILLQQQHVAQTFSFWDLVRCYTFVQHWVGGLLSPGGWQPNFVGYCPNQPVWTVSTLISCWLAYPLMQLALSRQSQRRSPTMLLMGTAALWALVLLIEYWAISYPSSAEYIGLILHFNPLPYLPDFALGVVAADFSLRHKAQGRESGGGGGAGGGGAGGGRAPPSDIESASPGAEREREAAEAAEEEREEEEREEEEAIRMASLEVATPSTPPPTRRRRAERAEPDGGRPHENGFTHDNGGPSTSKGTPSKAYRGGSGGGGAHRAWAVSGARWGAICAVLADVWVVCFVASIFLAPTWIDALVSGTPTGRNFNGDEGVGAHFWSPAVAAYLYLAANASGGGGYASRFLRHPALSSLGAYALHVYLFSWVVKLIVEYYSSGRMWGEGDWHFWVPKEGSEPVTADTFSSPDKKENARVYLTLLLLLYVGAAIYAHLIEEPIVLAFRRYCARRSAAGSELGSSFQSAVA